MISSATFERKVFWIGMWMVAAGTAVTALSFGLRYGICFLLGGLLSAVNLKLLIRTVNAALARSDRISGIRITAGYILRLLLIPLCLYAIMHFLFSGIIAATAGFVVFSSGFLIEGIFEAVKSGDR
ncbi:MAG TPA: ATP synthase subunit I [Acidobacteriota bacterium]|nr:ATP synthase subunit I [Acidobacteriota bacterium]